MSRFEIFHQDQFEIVINVDNILYIQPYGQDGEHSMFTLISGESKVVTESFSKVSKMLVQPSKIF